MSTVKGKLFHLVVVVYYLSIDYHVFTSVVPKLLKDIHPVRENIFSMSIQFATIWAQVLQQLYFLCCFFEDVLEFTNESKYSSFKQKLSDFTHNLFTCFTFPFSIIVSVNFWILFTHNPLNLDPFNALYEYISRWLNHAVHTHIVLLVLVEICTNYREYPLNIKTGFKKIAWTILAYIATVIVSQPFCSVWVYPFYGMMTITQAVIFTIGNLLFTNMAYVFGHTINAVVWGRQPAIIKMVQVKKMYADVIGYNTQVRTYLDKYK